jgi:hypothetical protein
MRAWEGGGVLYLYSMIVYRKHEKNGALLLTIEYWKNVSYNLHGINISMCYKKEKLIFFVSDKNCSEF